MADKLLKTNALNILKNITLRPMPDVSQSSLNTWTNGAAIRSYVKAPEVGSFVSAGRVGNATNTSLGADVSFSPIFVWGGGDGFSMLITQYNFDKYGEKGISLCAGTNGSLYQTYLAKTDWVKTYLENQKTTTQDIENLFS